MKIVGKTNIGLVREENQDNFYISPMTSQGQYVIVCDGMGGANAGSVASELSIDYIKTYIEEHDEDEPDLIKLMLSSIDYANKTIYEKSIENKSYEGMGTTVVLAYFHNNKAYIAHVGDSRAYFISNEVSQLTVDHSMVQDLLLKGTISEQEAKNHPQKNIITRALGVSPTVQPDMDILEMDHEGTVLICTDGLSSVVEEKDVLIIVQENDLEHATDQLIDKANALGGPDNITVVLIRYEEGGKM